MDTYNARARKRAEEHLSHLLDDMRAIVDSQNQIDPTLTTNCLFTRLSVAEVRRKLIVYRDVALQANEMGYGGPGCQESEGMKNTVPVTDAVFDQLEPIYREAANDATLLHLSRMPKPSCLYAVLSPREEPN